jgi:ATP-dependent exoDNAse (exonuclease V) beta subunit
VYKPEDDRGFFLYRASAGAGKTYTLVKEYLKLVLENPETFKNILAITFTNKAAAEMKERVLLRLKELSKGENKDLEEQLVKINPRLSNIPLASSELLTQLLHNYSDFAIMTIDSFIHKVLRAFALELGLPLTFSIDLNYERLYTYVVERLINYVGRDEHITRVVLDLVYDRIAQGKSWNIENDIRGFVGELFNEKNTDWAKEIESFGPELFLSYRSQLNAYRFDYIRRMQELGIRGLEMITESGLKITDFAYGDKGAAGFFEVCRTLDEKALNTFSIRGRFLQEIWVTKKAPAEMKAKIEALLTGGLSAIHQEMIEVHSTHFKKALTAHFMLENLYLAAIIGEVRQLIEEYKSRNNVVPIAEFNIKVYEIVKYSPVPFIYAILGEKYNHYLIDEFQDTSRMQWENLYPLIENALASGTFNMAVGDGKQSIYRWRGGDVEIMEHEIELGVLGEHVKKRYLEENYRSREKVIEFNNKFFEKIHETGGQDNPLIKSIYHEAEQFNIGKKGGYVSLQFIPETNTIGEADPMVFEKVNRIVHDALNKWLYRGKDIAILVRSKKEGRKIAENLLENGYDVVSPDSLVLANIPLVRFLIDVLTYLNNPSDKIARASIIYYLSLNRREKPVKPEEIGKYFMSSGDSDEQDKLIGPEITQLFRLRNTLIRMPVYEVMEEVVRIFDLQGLLDFKTAGYLQAFLDIVAHYSADNNVDFASFLDWWESNEEDFALEVPEDADAIKIMTIHKCKGLEFPVVIVPYAHWEHSLDKKLWLKPDPKQFKLDPELKIPMPVRTRQKLQETLFIDQLNEEEKRVEVDNVNMLYVTFTRAVDHLYIISRTVAEKTNKNQPNPLRSNYRLLHDLAVPIMEKEALQEEQYTLGTPVVKSDDPAKPGDVIHQPEELLISTQWDKKISIRRRAVEFWRFDTDYREEQRSWGILVHFVLATISHWDDVPRVIHSILHSGDIEVNEQEPLIEKINAIFEIPQIREWFNPAHQVFNESPIITDDGVIRPDRVVVTDEKVIVIDFKTGQKQATHSRQLNTYRQALKDMGYTHIETYLLYLDEPEIVAVKEEQGNP